MSDNDWLLNGDPNYDGQGKSRSQETDGAMRAVGCLIGVIAMMTLFMIFVVAFWLLWG